MITSAFCDELIKMSMDPEFKDRMKANAKIVGAATLGAGAAHGTHTLVRYLLEKNLTPAQRAAAANKIQGSKLGPKIYSAALGAALGGLAQARRNVHLKAQEDRRKAEALALPPASEVGTPEAL